MSLYVKTGSNRIYDMNRGANFLCDKMRLTFSSDIKPGTLANHLSNPFIPSWILFYSCSTREETSAELKCPPCIDPIVALLGHRK